MLGGGSGMNPVPVGHLRGGLGRRLLAPRGLEMRTVRGSTGSKFPLESPLTTYQACGPRTKKGGSWGFELLDQAGHTWAAAST